MKWWFAVVAAAFALVVTVAAAIGGGRSAVATALSLPFAAFLTFWLWRAARVTHRQRGVRRVVGYLGISALAVVELWVFVAFLFVAGVIAEALFPFEAHDRR